MHQTNLPRLDQDTLSSIFKRRVSQTPDSIAYIQFNKKTKTWDEFSWKTQANDVMRLQAGLLDIGIDTGMKIAIMQSNCREWIAIDQAAQGLGVVTVPVYTNDRAENVDHILQDAEIDVFVIENSNQLSQLDNISETLKKLKKIILINDISDKESPYNNLVFYQEMLNYEASELISRDILPEKLATIVYTSGTTGKPKGVMLSHLNILSNIYSGLSMVDVHESDRFLSFLPLSHMLERMVGYYLPIVTGSSVAFSRSIAQLANDLQQIQPTIMVSVPRIFERVFGKIQDKLDKEKPLKRKIFNTAIKLGWRKFQMEQGDKSWTPALLLYPALDKIVGHKVRQQLGGRLRFTVCGGAALSSQIAEFFIGLGIPILQGYGLTETSPVISVNRLTDNVPASVGLAMPGIDVKVGANDELLTKSDSVMMGYWNNEEATRQIIDEDGWLHTGDKVSIRDDHVFITGRIKEIIVLGNGEKVPPSDMELAISLDNLVDQVMIVGEGRAYLSALLVLNESGLDKYKSENGITDGDWDYVNDKALNKHLLSLIKRLLRGFPGYAKIRRVSVCEEPWSIENGMLTPTLKMKRAIIENNYSNSINKMYDDLA
ncbi:MAG: long-chain fatty acid--CoA ligase [Gammaproteobacteria bacterium]|nr:long-chain fatty acid--CoA ligase [Gammaproteobacteria bacterium]